MGVKGKNETMVPRKKNLFFPIEIFFGLLL